MFDSVLGIVLPAFRPSVVVVCCGVDGLASDRMSPFNLTTRAYPKCVHTLMKKLGHDAAAPHADTTPPIALSPAPSAGVAQVSDTASKSPDGPTQTQTQQTDIGAPTTVAVGLAPETTVEPDTTVRVTLSDIADTVVADSTSLPPPAASDLSSSAPLDSPTATGAASSSAWPSSPVPLLLLGGGGYNPQDVARAFTIVTATACGVTLPSRIPECDAYYPAYLATGFTLHSHAQTKETRPNRNDRAYLQTILHHVRESCQRWQRQEEELEAEIDGAQDDDVDVKMKA